MKCLRIVWFVLCLETFNTKILILNQGKKMSTITTLKNKTKLDEIENLIFLLGEANYRNGFPYFNHRYRKRKLLFIPWVFHSYYSIHLIRAVIALLITDETYLVFLGDFTLKTVIRIQGHLLCLNAYLLMLSVLLSNQLIDKKNKNTKITYVKESKRIW